LRGGAIAVARLQLAFIARIARCNQVACLNTTGTTVMLLPAASVAL
jgi:hypothetical protein